MTAARYEILVRGRLGTVLARSFEGIEVDACEKKGTYLRGSFDQASLHGLLAELGDLGVELSAIRRLSGTD
jgi:hypothetical protein